MKAAEMWKTLERPRELVQLSMLSDKLRTKKFRLFLATVLPFATFIGGTAHAQTERCIRALIQDTKVLDLRETASLARAEILRRAKSGDKNWAAGLQVQIKGIPAGGRAESSEATREQYFSTSRLNWNTERLVSVATQTLSQNAVEAYRTCLEGQLRSGPRIAVYDATERQATVSVRWLSPAGAPSKTEQVAINISGGKFQESFPDSWTTGQSHSVIVDREAGQDMRVVANIGAEDDRAFVSQVPAPPPPPPLRETTISCPQSCFWTNDNPSTVSLECAEGSALSEVFIDETAARGILRTPTGVHATCIGPLTGSARRSVSVKEPDLWNSSPSNEGVLGCSAGTLMNSLKIGFRAANGLRGINRLEAACSETGGVGASTVVRVDQNDFWNNNPTNVVRLECEEGSAISGFRTVLESIGGIRTATYYEITCTEY